VIILDGEGDGDAKLLDSKIGIYNGELICIALTTSYHRQRETIVTWLDELSQLDLAISFQELEGAQEAWEIIWNIQGKDPEDLSADDDSDDEFLPEPENDKLAQIHNFMQLVDMSKRAKVIDKILKDNEEYLFKLYKIFTKAEESNDFEVLKDIFLIYKDMLNIADIKLLEILMSDKHYLTVFGALEHIQISCK
jgi:protein phosphatase-4 regulatory subunit 3